jgi:hypothetical protein
VSWRQVYDDLAALLGQRYEFVDVPREDVLPYVAPPRASTRVSSGVRVLLSSEFRGMLAAVPVLRWIPSGALSVFRSLPTSLQQRVRERATWPVRVPQAPENGLSLGDRYVTVQLRRFYHSPEKLRTTLGWEPPLSHEKGLATLVSWLRFAGIVA